MKKDENIAKSIKNWIVVISSTTFVLNIFSIVSVNQIWLVSFTYLSSTALAFYNIDPNTEKSKKRRLFMINSGIACIAFIFIAGLLTNQYKFLSIIILYIIKLLFTGFGLMSVIFSFYDGTELITEDEEEIVKVVRGDLISREKKKPFIARDKTTKENIKTKHFVSKKNKKELEGK